MLFFFFFSSSAFTPQLQKIKMKIWSTLTYIVYIGIGRYLQYVVMMSMLYTLLYLHQL